MHTTHSIHVLMQKCTYDITFKFLCVFRAKGTYINEDQASSLGDPASQTAPTVCANKQFHLFRSDSDLLPSVSLCCLRKLTSGAKTQEWLPPKGTRLLWTKLLIWLLTNLLRLLYEQFLFLYWFVNSFGVVKNL